MEYLKSKNTEAYFQRKNWNIKDFYEFLSKIYSSPYPDSEQEKEFASETLYKCFEVPKDKHDDVSINLIKKIEELCAVSNGFKSKFNKVVLDKYWEKEYIKKIVLPKANPNQR
jgi:hypothetical protein